MFTCCGNPCRMEQHQQLKNAYVHSIHTIWPTVLAVHSASAPGGTNSPTRIDEVNSQGDYRALQFMANDSRIESRVTGSLSHQYTRHVDVKTGRRLIFTLLDSSATHSTLRSWKLASCGANSSTISHSNVSVKHKTDEDKNFAFFPHQ